MKRIRIVVCLAVVLALAASASAIAQPIYFNDFENLSNPLTEWSSQGNTPSGDPAGRTPGTAQHPADRFLGQFCGNEWTTLSLSNLPNHTSLTVSFDLYLIRTWDGTGSFGYGPDVWNLSIIEGQTLLHSTFSNTEAYGNIYQNYPNQYPGADVPARSGAIENNTLGFIREEDIGGILDSVYHLTFTFDHSSNSIAINFSGIGLQTGIYSNVYDESWGLDNVSVVPEPATLLLFGFGAFALRRKNK